MRWHIVVHVGPKDEFMPPIGNSDPRVVVGLERPADPWRVGSDFQEVMEKATGGRCPATAADLVCLAMAVYTADLRVPRSCSVEKWSRELCVHFPVHDVGLWTKAVPVLTAALQYLSGDSWEFELRPRRDVEKTGSSGLSADVVCLFSGGLDSLVGGIDLLRAMRRVALVGHHGAGMTGWFQSQVLSELGKRYEEQICPFLFYVQPPKNMRRVQSSRGSAKQPRRVEGEPSMRTRSFLFFSLGVAVVERLGERKPLTVAENGLISLNVPLTDARTGSLSTRTTHPHFVALYRKLLAKLGLQIEIDLPYRFKTKGEMLTEVVDRVTLENTAKLTMSCSHPEAGRYRGRKPRNHCGYCVPCTIRRAGMLAAGINDAAYSMDVRKERPSSESRTGQDLRSFEIAVERFTKDPNSRLFDVLSSGPLPPDDVGEYVRVYERGMQEVRRFLLGGES